MNETTLALCKKPAIGLVMWLTSLCVTNQGLHDAYLDLNIEGATLTQEFQAPMDEVYVLSAYLKSMNNDSNEKSWNDLLCKDENTISIEIEIKTKKLESVYNENLTRNCDANAVETWDIARIGKFNLKKGDYIFTATNIKKIPIRETQKVQLILIGTKSAGFP